MIVDLGGGTADIVVHAFKSTGNVTKLVEATPGYGAHCGGTVVV